MSFRPIQTEYYNDTIEFVTTQGNFFIGVVATLPEFGVKMQKYLDFGFSTVKEESVKTFTLRNVGEVDAPFELLSEFPFTVSPIRGNIKPGKMENIRLNFFPTEASVYVGTIVCKQPEPRPALVMKISGIGKIPHIAVSKHMIDYEQVLTGQHRTEEIILTNTALVPVSFEIRPHPHDHDNIFHWQSWKGRIPADGSTALNIKYSPLSTGSFDLDYFDVVTPGGNLQTICCKGFAEPHRVEVFVPPPKTNPDFVALTPALNFGNLELGRVSMKTVELINKTKARAFYQFVTEPTGCFEFSRADGIIIPESTVNVDIRFKARIPGNYYRRIFILVKNQGPLYLDLTATAYHQLQDQVPRPMPLYQRHVELYRKRLQDERKPHAAAIYDSENKGDPSAESWNEFFFDDTDDRREIYLQEADIDFGAMSNVGGVGDYRSITVVNRTDVKYTAMFMVPPDNYVDQPEGAGEIELTTLGPVLRPLETCWKIFPEKADILPHSSTQFKVAFRPVYGNAYYAQALELFAYPKSQRNFRLVTDENFVPSHCVRPVCSGNTFPASMEAFTPKLRVPTTRINFPPCTVYDKAYQVVEMLNDADTPMRYQFDADQLGIYMVKPNNGLIMPQCAQLVAFKFWPKEAKRYKHTITCTMNGSALHAVEFTLVGKGNASAVTLDTLHLQIKPTCVGSVATRTVVIHNPTGIPMYYNWVIPEAYRRVLLVEPKQGVLRGNERHTLYWHFAPKKTGSYSMKIPVTIERAQVRDLADNGFTSTVDMAETMNLTYGTLTKKPQTVWLNIYGAGSGGAVKFEPDIIDFNELVVGTEVTQVIKLVNQSDVTMYHDIVSSMPDNLHYKDGQGFISANSVKRVTICFTPDQRKYYNVTISCKLSTGSEANSTLDQGPNHTGMQLLMDAPLEELPECQVLGNAVYPTLAIMDVRAINRLENWRSLEILPWDANGGGPFLRDQAKAMVPAATSASRLWTEMNLLEMNDNLSSDLSAKEILWNKAEIDETNPSKVLKVMDVRFEVKEQESQSSVSVIRLKNTGVLALDLLLKYPKDDEDEPENWVDKDLQGEEELKLNYMLENKLFICEPRRAHLEVGEEIDLILSYKHTVKGDPRSDPPYSKPLYNGDFRLPVVCLCVCVCVCI